MVIPGSHKSFLRCPGRQRGANWEKSLQSQVYGTPAEEHLRQLAESNGIEHCTGAPGDVQNSKQQQTETVQKQRVVLQQLFCKSLHPFQLPHVSWFQVLFFDSNLLHASSGNRSPFPRRNVFVAFNAWSNRLQEPFYSKVWHVAGSKRSKRWNSSCISCIMAESALQGATPWTCCTQNTSASIPTLKSRALCNLRTLLNKSNPTALSSFDFINEKLS